MNKIFCGDETKRIVHNLMLTKNAAYLIMLSIL